MLCIYAHLLHASVNWWELLSLKAFDKNQDVDSRSRKKKRVHLILCANLIQDQLTASLTA